MMPIDFAIAFAVAGWSPVTMMTCTPADWQRSTAPGTDSRGGSSSAVSPTNVMPCMGKPGASWSKNLSASAAGGGAYDVSARPSTRSPLSISVARCSFTRATCSGVQSTTPSRVRILLQRSSTRSGAPLKHCLSMPGLLSSLWMVTMNLLVELNGMPPTCGLRARTAITGSICSQNLRMPASDASPFTTRSMIGLSGNFSMSPLSNSALAQLAIT
mmetsp:Transcript_11070/g.29726  ORF Transcript_11070/g.29726 Transcript_11070/m.29726 type:complete len:215 (-) Transcript_11070:141-785(-)